MYIILKLEKDQLPSQAVINKLLADKGIYQDKQQAELYLNKPQHIIVLI